MPMRFITHVTKRRGSWFLDNMQRETRRLKEQGCKKVVSKNVWLGAQRPLFFRARRNIDFQIRNHDFHFRNWKLCQSEAVIITTRTSFHP